jgi:hypothetical protein
MIHAVVATSHNHDVSPQCGFASVEAGNPIKTEIQEARLRLVVDLTNAVWGSAQEFLADHRGRHIEYRPREV